VTTGATAPVALPASVHAEAGQGGLDRLVVTTAAATGEVYLQGAHVTGWAPAGQEPVIWMSERSTFAPGSPIRGGVPVCFPWFGPHPSGEAPLHGFARITDWALVDAAEAADAVTIVLRLTDSEATRASAWGHPFDARYTLTFGASLTLALEVTNTGAEPVTFAEAFHTYLAVGDVRDVTVTGLEDASFVDRLVGPDVRPAAGEALAITAETDRVYDQPGTVIVQDPALGRTVTVRAGGSANAVVWNPWIAKAAAMGDFGDEEWRAMLCVETCNVLDGSVTLAPGASHTMTAIIAVAPLA
jgi:D-hexose-6-phosphate mutarotase